MEKLSLFFTATREMTFWKRLFSWRPFRSLSYEAYEEFRHLVKENESLKNSRDHFSNARDQLEISQAHKQDRVHDLEISLTKKMEETETLREKIESLRTENSRLQNIIAVHNSADESRNNHYQEKIAQLNGLKESLETERKRLQEERLKEQEESFERMKRQWVTHEQNTKEILRSLCSKYTVKYIDKPPFRGTPDNTIEICDEYVIFDAKSPANDDLSNFPKYIRMQTDSVRKYAGQEKVRKDVFLVVPTNTIHCLPELFYNMGDYNVLVITKDAIEPILISLRKLEEYEFVNQLSPDERENLCRLIGKFVHATKRKLQVEQFFATEFLELLARYKDYLPADFRQQVSAYETAEKLNPPPEKKIKHIPTKELAEKHAIINAEAGIREIVIPLNFDEVKKLH